MSTITINSDALKSALFTAIDAQQELERITFGGDRCSIMLSTWKAALEQLKRGDELGIRYV
jgi:hypothetical protein